MASRHELALRYNDSSVVENHALATLFGILADPTQNILDGLTDAEWREARSVSPAIYGEDSVPCLPAIK